MQRVASADRGAFDELYRATSAALFGMVLRINRDRGHAEEVLQEIYITVWRQAPSFDAAHGKVLTWLTTIARHRAIDSLRRRAAQPATISRFGGIDGGSDGGEGERDLLDHLPSEQPSPLDLLDDANRAHALERCMSQLSGEQRSEPGPGVLPGPVAYRGRGAHEPAAGHGEELGAARAAEPARLPGPGDRTARDHGQGGLMDYGHPERAERLAADYAVGTLRGGARRRFERLLPAHPALAAATATWAARLQLLAEQVGAVDPPPSVWATIQMRLFGASEGESVSTQPSTSASAVPTATATPTDARSAAANDRRGALRFWRGLSAVALAASVVLAVIVARPVPEAAPIVVVLRSTPEGVELVKTGFVASVSADGRALVLKPLAPVVIDAAHALELWAVPKAGAPRSLGLIAAGDVPTTVTRANLLADTQAFAVSLEPSGGSRSGKPTGPIVSAGGI
ncbi:sigma-70 family RNA polymerase sigma factor [Roseateles chitinivorans]|uniref:sigma-70 family RNA polymerase sigma factor n=1 Tax=Roseateles chitinivorans TaxID=2917965 RepID=UPI003D675FE8